MGLHPGRVRVAPLGIHDLTTTESAGGTGDECTKRAKVKS